MGQIETLIQTPVAGALGWTLVHSLWQGMIAGLILAAILLGVRSPRIRYAWACLAMLSVLAGFILTFSLLASRSLGNSTPAPHAILRIPKDAVGLLADEPAGFRMVDALPWLVPFWGVGVIIFHLRSVASWLTARRLRHRGVCLAPETWQQRLNQLSARLPVSKPVALLETCLTGVPVVIGYLRPVILVPVGLLAGMPASQMEGILLHELAHIYRRDYLANLLQTVVEGLLFYHPAIWWITGVIRAERENCCDDLAVAASGNAHAYAAALTALEQNRWSGNQAALAATGGSLVKRIRRLLYQPEGSALAPLFSAVILTLTVAGALAAWQARIPASSTPAGDLVAQAGQPPAPGAKLSPYTRWLQEDVVYIIEDAERAAFQRLQADAERDHFIEQFWLRRDPTPGTPENEFRTEHYRRIAYANSHFAWRTVPGWKTDRGRIYIVFGPPDELESHPSGRPAGAGAKATDIPTDQWLYHYLKGIGNNVIIDFEDPAKTGDFHMTMDPDPQKGTPVRRP